jgi:hypothetical protein
MATAKFSKYPIPHQVCCILELNWYRTLTFQVLTQIPIFQSEQKPALVINGSLSTSQELATQSWQIASTCHPSSEASLTRHKYWQRSKQRHGRRNWKGGCSSYLFDGEAPHLARPREVVPRWSGATAQHAGSHQSEWGAVPSLKKHKRHHGTNSKTPLLQRMEARLIELKWTP